MWTMRLLLGLAVILVGCARPHRQPVQAEDPSVRFPDFDASSVISVGADGKAYDLDGLTLRALLIAANDFLPPGGKHAPCRDRQEAHRYRVVRQGDIVFVRIEDDDVFCGLKYLSLDTGARYAIRIDGRILRRSFGAEPDAVANPGSSPDSPFPDTHAEPHDGGTPPPVSADSGLP